jgi:cytochrome c oxidase subunit III
LSVEAHPALAHHFDDLEQQREAGTLGMWVFLATEIMVFGGLFGGYTVYRYSYPDAFGEASSKLVLYLATINTVVLISSSLTMAMAVWGAQTGRRQVLIGFLVLTLLLGFTFLGIKIAEYVQDYHEGLVPLPGLFHGDVFSNQDTRYLAHVRLFLVLYFVMTGLHATHMLFGFGALTWLIVLAYRGRFSPDYHPQVELVGLYWHFVDVIWIFLLPLLYLIG